MRRKKVILAVSLLLIFPILVWSAERTFTTYTSDSDIGVAPETEEGQFEINPDSVSVPRNPAGTGTFAIIMSGSCAADTWTAASDASWLTISAGAAGTGSGAVTYRYAVNAGGPGTPMRIGNIKVAAASCGQRIFSLCQNGFSQSCP